MKHSKSRILQEQLKAWRQADGIRGVNMRYRNLANRANQRAKAEQLIRRPGELGMPI